LQPQVLVAHPKRFMRLPAFSNRELWGDGVERSKAIAFCRDVGFQLYREYLRSKTEVDGWAEWPEDRIREYALGTRSLGLSIAFAHSVPKASLPLFWAFGKVKLKSRTRRKVAVSWQPRPDVLAASSIHVGARITEQEWSRSRERSALDPPIKIT
jgi:hypothetical protein